MNFYKLIQGDCLKVLPMLEDESIDCVITDFPYNVGKGFVKGCSYYKLIEDTCRELKRVLKPDTNFVFYIGDKDISNKLGIVSKYFHCEIVKKRCFGRTFLDRQVKYEFEVMKWEE